MRKLTSLVCLLLCLALLPVAASAEGGAAMTPVTLMDITFYVWSDWEPQDSSDGTVTYYGTYADPPFSGYLSLITQDGLVLFDQTPEQVLRAVAEGVTETMDEGYATEQTTVGGRDGMFVSGTMYGGFFRNEVYLCISGTSVVAAALGTVDGAKGQEALRAMLLEVIGASSDDGVPAGAGTPAAPSDAPVRHEVKGVPYFIRESWREIAGEGNTVYYQKSDSVYDGCAVISAYESPALNGQNTTAALEVVATELSGSVGKDEELAMQATDIGGREGLFVSGTAYGLIGLDGYLCFSEGHVVSIVLMDGVSGREALHGLLLEVLGE